MRAAVLTVLSIMCCAAHAETLSDPMRPPVYQPVTASGSSGPVLQTVVIGKDRRYAIISGERVRLGGAYGDAKITRIVENEVTLRDASGETVLKLVPEIKKVVVSTKQVATDADKGGKGKQ